MGTLRRYPRFAIFFAGQAVSLVGSWMTRVALSWLVYRLTGSVMMLALVAFAGQAPLSVFALLGGALVDRWDRRRVLIVSKLAAALLAAALAALTLSEAASVPALLALAALQGLQQAVDMPARQALLPELVTDPEDLPSAIALNSSMVHAARFLGPFTAGWVITHFGEGYCFAIDALSYVAVLGSLWVLRITPVPSRPRTGLFAELREGYRYVRGDARVRAPLLLLAAISLSGWSYSVLLPDYVAHDLRAGATTLGHLMAASGAGALACAVWLAQRKTASPERWLGSLAGSVGVALILLSLASSAWFAAAALTVVGAGMMLLLALCNTTVQLNVPGALRGRVMGFFTLASFGTLPLGNLLAGLLASHFGSRLTLAISGAASLLAALVYARRCQVQVPSPGAKSRPTEKSAMAGPTNSKAGLSGVLEPAGCRFVKGDVDARGLVRGGDARGCRGALGVAHRASRLPAESRLGARRGLDLCRVGRRASAAARAVEWVAHRSVRALRSAP